jgi:16S rRNA (uracil1498-N3)-methyltransferase
MTAGKKMAGKASRVRLFVDAPYAAGAELKLSTAQSHYLGAVMRLTTGDSLAIFNGCDGEWRAVITAMRRGVCRLAPEQQIRRQQAPTGPWLLFAAIKSARGELLIEKACEMGVSELWPVTTQFSQGKRIKLERYRARAIEAAEQCGRLEVPRIRPFSALADVLRAWPADRRILFCDETGGPPALETLEALGAEPPGLWAILIGPEGGFSPAERADLGSRSSTVAISLGPRVLRAETAAVAALGLWQAVLGDLRQADSDPTS